MSKMCYNLIILHEVLHIPSFSSIFIYRFTSLIIYTFKHSTKSGSQAAINSWVIPCQFNQHDWHDRLVIAWNLVHLLGHMRYVQTRKEIFFGQLLSQIRVVEIWPDPLDLVPLDACISACMRARKVFLVSLFSSFDELFGQIIHDCLKV